MLSLNSPVSVQCCAILFVRFGTRVASYFTTLSYEVGGEVFSMADLEHCVLRAKTSQPKQVGGAGGGCWLAWPWFGLSWLVYAWLCFRLCWSCLVLTCLVFPCLALRCLPLLCLALPCPLFSCLVLSLCLIYY